MSEKRIDLRIKWLGCACFELDFGGITVVNDSWITPKSQHRADTGGCGKL